MWPRVDLDDDAIRDSFGVLPGRVTYVVDRDGTVRHVFSSMANIDRHVGDAVAVVKRLQAGQTNR